MKKTLLHLHSKKKNGKLGYSIFILQYKLKINIYIKN